MGRALGGKQSSLNAAGSDRQVRFLLAEARSPIR